MKEVFVLVSPNGDYNGPKYQRPDGSVVGIGKVIGPVFTFAVNGVDHEFVAHIRMQSKQWYLTHVRSGFAICPITDVDFIAPDSTRRSLTEAGRAAMERNMRDLAARGTVASEVARRLAEAGDCHALFKSNPL